MYKTITGGELKLLEATVPEHPLVIWFRDQDGREDPAQDQWDERRDALRIECGTADAEAAADARYNEKMDIYDKLIATPVWTAAGLLIKVEAGDLVHLIEDEDWVDNLRDDIKRLAQSPTVVAPPIAAKLPTDDPTFAAIDRFRSAFVAMEFKRLRFNHFEDMALALNRDDRDVMMRKRSCVW